MKKSSIYFAVAALTFGSSCAVWAENPCKPIASACEQQGYYKGGNKVGKGLIENCVLPVVNDRKTLPNMTFSMEEKKQCRMVIMQKMKGKMGS